MSKQLGEIITQRDRPSIKIDGVAYPLIEPEDLKLKDALWLEKAAKRMDVLIKAELSSNDDALLEMTELIFKVTDLLMGDIPVAIRTRLSEMQKLSVIQAYMGLLSPTVKKGEKAPLAEGEDGKASSPDSSTSMGEGL
jgi:hypothetical protein